MPPPLTAPALALSLVTSSLIAAPSAHTPVPPRVYLGTYTTDEGGGIHVFDFDAEHGTLNHGRVAVATQSPSFLAAHPRLPVLYAVNELDRFLDKPEGGVTAFSIHDADGTLHPLNAASSGGAHPCHIAVDDTGRFLAVANYTGGTVALFELAADGSIGRQTDLVHHKGSGPHTSRQKGPHPHGVYFLPGLWLLVPDLGLDKVAAYQVSPHGRLTRRPERDLRVGPGRGPRHVAMNRAFDRVFVLNELASTLEAFCWPPALDPKPSVEVSSLPPDFKGPNTCAEIALHPNGQILLASNRGHDSIAAFRLGLESGEPRPLHVTQTGGKTPRHFALDPSGFWLAVAHQDSDTVQVFRMDVGRGAFHPSGPSVKVPRPVCALFISRVSAAHPPEPTAPGP